MKEETISSGFVPSVNSTLDLREVVTIYLKLYDTHWNHRIKIFSFFITIEVVLLGAYATLLFDVFDSANNLLLMAILAVAACLVAVILFFLDWKIKKLLRLTCQALRKFEEIYEAKFPPEMRLMSNIEATVANPDLTSLFWLSYGIAFAMGIVCLIISAFMR